MFLRYGPIPIVTEVLDPNGDLLSGYTERPTVKEYVVDFILKELQECESGLLSKADAWNYHALYGKSALQCRLRHYVATGS